MGAPWGNTPWANLGIVKNQGFDGMIEVSHTTSYGLYLRCGERYLCPQQDH